jgi:hypothetical protein
MDFLIERFTIFDIEFQYWMPIVVGVYIIFVAYRLMKGTSG